MTREPKPRAVFCTGFWPRPLCCPGLQRLEVQPAQLAPLQALANPSPDTCLIPWNAWAHLWPSRLASPSKLRYARAFWGEASVCFPMKKGGLRGMEGTLCQEPSQVISWWPLLCTLSSLLQSWEVLAPDGGTGNSLPGSSSRPSCSPACPSVQRILTLQAQA